MPTQIKQPLFLAAWVLIISCTGTSRLIQKEQPAVKFYVDPATNSDDMEIRMAYGLNIVPPWPDGGSIFVNLPEHLAYMPETKGIARNHDKRKNVWQAKADSSEAGYDIESITEPDVFITASHDDRKVVLHWTPGKDFLSNSFIPCIHADPCIGDLPPRESRTVKGELIFTRVPFNEILKQLPVL